ncbi:C2H2 finger domain transcription factor mtfA [Penicillium rolfsii]|nr:C2H2 finger domain transcription factor mtfA [Penicillium rolfsii]
MDLASLLHGAAPAPKLYTETYGKRSLQAPLSPPVEDHQPKCSLPSISTLLEGAEHSAKRQRLSPPAHQRDARYNTISMPPTPPLRPGSGSGHSSISHSPVELNTPKHSSPHMHRSSISSNTSSTAAHASHAHSHGPYASPAPSTSSSTGSTYTSPVESNPPTNNTLYYPRPPSTTTFNPAPTTPALNTTNIPSSTQQPSPGSQQSPAALISPVTPAWQHQHHHYFPPSSAAPYQQNHDRYICRTCHKAFSRPSSLRIHSHSHTGEKPFHCTHPGCGKAFSVRSNMKRHERGCHSGRPVVPAPQALVS